MTKKEIEDKIKEVKDNLLESRRIIIEDMMKEMGIPDGFHRVVPMALREIYKVGMDHNEALFNWRKQLGEIQHDINSMVNRHDATKEFPPKLKGWNHSNRVLVYYEAIPDLNLTNTWSIAYYHYEPPFKDGPEWTDFNVGGRTPKYWWDLPNLEVEENFRHNVG